MSRQLLDRTISNRSLVSIDEQERQLLTPGVLPGKGNIWWDPGDLARGTTVTVSGSQTITGPTAYTNRRMVEVSSVASQSANDVNCVLYPANLATGQTWRVTADRFSSSTGVFLMTFIVLTDGVTATSNAAVTMVYQTTSNNLVFQAWWGTLTNLSNNGTATTFTGNAEIYRGLYTHSIEYTGANSFSMALLAPFSGRVIASSGAHSVTMTPTHVGIGWSIWGTSPASNSMRFGPIYRSA